MVAKEWHDARWKFLVAAVSVVLLVFLLSPYEVFLEEARRGFVKEPVKDALRDLSELYYLGAIFVLLPLAALLGVASISGEVSNGTIFLLLSRPMSRTRLLLTKYAIGAGTLLVAVVLGKILLLIVAAARGYPLGQMHVLEAVLSVVVLWLGVLFVLGTAILVSIIFRSVVTSIVACALTLFFVFTLPPIIAEFYPWGDTYDPYELSVRLWVLTYWMPTYYYSPNPSNGIGGFAFTSFLVCLIAAALPLLAALWIFRRKAY
jgi:ABC-2 type transport system permease protein